MATTTGVVIHAKGDLRVEQVAVREPASDEAIIDIVYGGICGSDLHYFSHGAAGQSVLRAPMVLGHEVVGVVAREAADGRGFAIGTAVAVHPATPTADVYPADRPNLAAGGTYLGSAFTDPHTDGAFVGRATLPSRMLRQLPASLDLRRAALIEPASVAWRAVSRAQDVRGRRALVIGAGPIGALAVAALKRAGAAHITAVDVHENPLSIARAVGADATLLASDAEAITAVAADVVIESSGSAPGLASALRGAARAARVVMVGLLPAGDQPVAISLAVSKELELVGSFRFNDEIDEVIAALADGSLFVDPIVTHEFPVADAIEAFTVARDPSVSGKVLLRF